MLIPKLLKSSLTSWRHRNRRPLSKLIEKARKFADAFQDKLNGLEKDHANPIRMRLTDSNRGPLGKPSNSNTNQGIPDNGSRGSGFANNSVRGSARSSQPGVSEAPPSPMTSLPPQQPDQLAGNDSATSPAAGSDQSPSGTERPPNDSDPSSGGGSNHGSGTDPSSLYGQEGAQPLGSDSFKIAIEAEPSDESSSPGSPTYVPPRIRVPLNSEQYPDQPLARAAVPAADQTTIKRVFER
jgi:hypothetical protein